MLGRNNRSNNRMNGPICWLKLFVQKSNKLNDAWPPWPRIYALQKRSLERKCFDEDDTLQLQHFKQHGCDGARWGPSVYEMMNSISTDSNSVCSWIPPTKAWLYLEKLNTECVELHHSPDATALEWVCRRLHYTDFKDLEPKTNEKYHIVVQFVQKFKTNVQSSYPFLHPELENPFQILEQLDSAELYVWNGRHVTAGRSSTDSESNSIV